MVIEMKTAMGVDVEEEMNMITAGRAVVVIVIGTGTMTHMEEIGSEIGRVVMMDLGTGMHPKNVKLMDPRIVILMGLREVIIIHLREVIATRSMRVVLQVIATVTEDMMTMTATLLGEMELVS